MPYCRNCGTQLPEDATFCPSCGARVEARAQFTPEPRETALRYVTVGLMGAFLSVIISSFSDIELYFLPSFVSSIFIAYIYRIDDVKGALIATFAVHLFSEAILGTLVLGQYYVLNQRIIFMPGLFDVVLYPFYAISAVVAAYIGVRISPKRKRAEPVFRPYQGEEGPGGVIYSM